VNGVLDGSETHVNTSYDAVSFQFNYDSSITDTYRFFKGYIKKAKVFNRTLSAEEITIEADIFNSNKKMKKHKDGTLYISGDIIEGL